MKKLILLLVAVLVLTVILPGCGNSAQSSQSTPNSTFEGKTLIMATEASFRPYEYYDDAGNVSGVDIDIANEIANELGMTLEISEMAFDTIIPMVKSGQVNFGAAGISISEERAEQVDFTIEYATSKQVIITKADSDIMVEDDLDGKTVGVQTGTVADIYLSDERPDVTLQRYNKYFEAASDLANGRIDAIVVDFLPAQEIVKTADGLVVREKELFTDRYAMCVQKGNTELLEAINKVLQRLVDEGKIDEFTSTHLA